MLSLFLLVPSALVICFLLFGQLLEPKPLPNEPPVLRSRIPLIGHIIGIIQHGLLYFRVTSTRTSAGIYTLYNFNSKLHIINSPSLILAAARASKTIQFDPLISEIGSRLTGVNSKTSSVLAAGAGHPDGYISQLHEQIVVALSPGASLKHMGRVMLMTLAKTLNELPAGKIELFSWLRDLFGRVSTDAIYGELNPMKEPGALDDFWIWEKDLTLMLINLLPQYTARTAHLARLRTRDRFMKYYASDFENHGASAYAIARYNVGKRFGFPDDQKSLLELGNLLGVLVNAIPAANWLLIHILVDKSLLEDIRRELDGVFKIDKRDAGKVHAVLDPATFRSNCPLLQSTYQESLRCHSLGATARVVTEDTMLDGKYLLTKNSVVQMTGAVTHFDKTVWNDTNFNARRFLPSEMKKSGVPSSQVLAAFRPFGGGSTLCPGRHFASFEILGYIAMIVFGFDLTLDEMSKVPKEKRTNMSAGVFPPQGQCFTSLRRREVGGTREWRFALTEKLSS